MTPEYLKYLYNLRQSVMEKDGKEVKILLANFEGSTQQRDIERTTPLIEQFFRIKEDVKVWKYPDFDWNDKEAIMQAMVERFDMPSWALYRLKGERELSEKLKNYNDVLIYQLKACNLRCPYCYVDDHLKNGKYDITSRFFSLKEILDVFVRERERRKQAIERGIKIDENGKLILELNRIRPSGGEPTLVIEQWLDLLKKLENVGLSKEVHMQSDTNLTTGHFIDFLEKRGEVRDILKQIAGFKNFSLLASFKGTDPENFSHNTRTPINLAKKLLKESLYSFKKYHDVGIDVYPFFYNPNPETLEKFLYKLVDSCGKEIYRRAWVFPLRVYDVTKERIGKEAKEKKVDEKIYVANYENRWKNNFEKSEEVMKKVLGKFGILYKKMLRV
jgi:uncharacterized Fe-S cluster-containing radical SAM superfamily protein